MNVKIDPEFRALIPPLSAEECQQLEGNLIADGCRDALVAWEGLLLDGHHRLEICQRHGIEFKVIEIKLANRETAADWIDANQLGRRNLAPDQMSLLRGRRYNRAKKAQGGDHKSNGQNVRLINQAEKLAKEHGVTEKTIRRDGQFAAAVEKVKAVDPEIEKKVVAGTAPGKAAIIEAAVLLAADPVKAQAVLDGIITVKAVRRQKKEQARESRRAENKQRAEKAVDPRAAGARFATIVIDPPWDRGDEGDVDQLGRAKPTYATMPIEEIEKLAVAELADVDCHLYLWITNRSLPKGFRLLDAWGFRYVTCLTWCKPSIGMGNYFRGSTEQVLFAVKGSQQLKRHDAGTWFAAARGREHSEKPDEFYTLVESCSPGPYLDMFARKRRKGWSVWGAEVC